MRTPPTKVVESASASVTTPYVHALAALRPSATIRLACLIFIVSHLRFVLNRLQGERGTTLPGALLAAVRGTSTSFTPYRSSVRGGCVKPAGFTKRTVARTNALTSHGVDPLYFHRSRLRPRSAPGFPGGARRVSTT